MPFSCGGLNPRSLEVWNKSAITKQLCAVEKKKERLWDNLMVTFLIYIKGQDLMSMKVPGSCSWMTTNIFVVRKEVLWVVCIRREGKILY